MSASLIFDLAPLGAIVKYSDGTPRPPERHRKKLAAWKHRKGRARARRGELESEQGADGGLLEAVSVYAGHLHRVARPVSKSLRSAGERG